MSTHTCFFRSGISWQIFCHGEAENFTSASPWGWPGPAWPCWGAATGAWAAGAAGLAAGAAGLAAGLAAGAG
ncbi:hypothetical protein FBQ73_00760 [Xanthobacter autotrophicus]|uniref:Uncharacterized protein n=1 Tax=Xanthobacter autotrophicus TaxID=280 RepID=A0A6C1KYF2_XANAU|nr:hypothetical protein FBQ73_00760 [Xanthobacter autotrophicus]